MNAFERIFQGEDKETFDDGSGFYRRVAALLKRPELTIEEKNEAFTARTDAVNATGDFIVINSNDSAIYRAAYLVALFDTWAQGICDE